MSLDASNALQRWFIQFWEFVEREIAVGNLQAEPLVRAQENWECWWAELLPANQREIECLGGGNPFVQECFAHWAQDWTDGRFKRNGAGRLVLTQLAQTAPFSTWPGWDSYRRGANLSVMQQPRGLWSPRDFKPLIVVAVERVVDEDYRPVNLEIDEALSLARSQAGYYQINLKVNEERAAREARRASLSAFRGLIFWLFWLLWAFCGPKNRRGWIRKLLAICWVFTAMGWALVASLLMFSSTSDLFGYFPDDRLLVPALSALVIVPLLGLLYVTLATADEGLRAWRSGWKWAKQMKKSQLYLLLSDWKTEPKLEVIGTSFGLMLALRNLLALYEAEPFPNRARPLHSPEQPSWRWKRFFKRMLERPSWLWGHFFETMAEKLPHLSGTGEITRWGWNKRVGRIGDKIAAAAEHPGITEMLAPLQKESFSHKRSSALRFHHCIHLAQAMLMVGNLVSRRYVLESVGMFAMSLFIALVALPDVISLATPPQIAYSQVFIPDPRFPTEQFFAVKIETNSPDEFEVCDHYEHRTSKLERDPHAAGFAVGKVDLNNQRPASFPHALIEVRRRRKLLGFTLPAKTVLAVTIP
jgi:hypothetical protein